MEPVTLQDGLYYITGTRIALASVVDADRAGETPEALCDAFPSLTAAKIHAAIAFCRDHPFEVDSYLRRLDAAFDSGRNRQPDLPRTLKAALAQRRQRARSHV